jgi:ribonucleoside-diphosphate reductase alpha chain
MQSLLSPAQTSSRRSVRANGRPQSPEELVKSWILVKRDGRKEQFSVSKIRKALAKCFIGGLNYPSGEAEELIQRITTRVVNFLDAQGHINPTVEDVQRAVITQLWSDGQVEAAEHYTIYREERRKARENKPIPAEVVRLINEDAKHFPTDLQYYQFISKFARWRDEDNRRETWREANDRVFDWFATLPQYQFLNSDEVSWLRQMMYTMKASPALRVLQMAGPALARCHTGCFNCTYHPISDWFSFAELLYLLMQGCGAGFSVETDYVSELPRIAKQKKPAVVHQFVIPDATEGWCDALMFGITRWAIGEDVEFIFDLLRSAGTRLKTKGGVSSGPGPLKELLSFVRSTFLGAQGRQLTDLEVHDICCMEGKIVQVGGVRRASSISLSDLDSVNMRKAKYGPWYEKHGYRSMANNSAVYDNKPSIEVFMREWLSLVGSRSGERGIFNREACLSSIPSRRKKDKFGGNPCLEIILRARQMCNLSISVLRGNETFEEMADKVRAATYFGMLQTCATNFQYIRPEWKKNVEEERLLGVDIMGHLDHPLLQPGAKGRAEIVTRLKEVVLETSRELAKRFGINCPTATTCMKPGGDSSELFNTVPLAPEYGTVKIRRTRESVHSPVCKFLKDTGVPWEPAAEDEAGLVAFAWPKKAPPYRITRHDMTAIDQLENWLFWKTTWAEHTCSVTIYVKDDEWLDVGAWVWKHFDQVTGLTFFPWDNGTYRTAPHEEITKEKYAEMLAHFPNIDWSKLIRYENGDQTVGSKTYACSSGSCELI